MRAIAVSNRRVVFPCLRISQKQRKMNFFSRFCCIKLFREMNEEREGIGRVGGSAGGKFLHGRLCALSS